MLPLIKIKRDRMGYIQIKREIERKRGRTSEKHKRIRERHRNEPSNKGNDKRRETTY